MLMQYETNSFFIIILAFYLNQPKQSENTNSARYQNVFFLTLEFNTKYVYDQKIVSASIYLQTQ